MKIFTLIKSVCIAATLLVAATPHASALVATNLPVTASGSLWLAPLDFNASAPHPGGLSGVNAVLASMPARAPDMTFSTNRIDYVDSGDYTIASFFDNRVFNVAFPAPNPNNVSGSTLLYSEDPQNQTGWGVYVDIVGFISLFTGDHIKIAHDDGVTLMLNGVDTGCFSGDDDSGGTHYTSAAAPQTCYYNGPSGLIPFELIYTEGYGGNAFLQMAVPEPGTLALLLTGFLAALLVVPARRRI